jgi:hypothetical protein
MHGAFLGPDQSPTGIILLERSDHAQRIERVVFKFFLGPIWIGRQPIIGHSQLFRFRLNIGLKGITPLAWLIHKGFNRARSLAMARWVQADAR